MILPSPRTIRRTLFIHRNDRRGIERHTPVIILLRRIFARSRNTIAAVILRRIGLSYNRKRTPLDDHIALLLREI